MNENSHSIDPSHTQAIAFFISPHGFGHGARAAGVMNAIHERAPGVRFEIFTRVPAWFFQDSVSAPFGYHDVLTDIGLVQKNPLEEDLAETVSRLDGFLPLDPALISRLAAVIKGLGCTLVVCDIAPMGILAAKAAGIPSVLVENFTWDWIYEAYRHRDARFGAHIHAFGEMFRSVDCHIQTRPVCHDRSTADFVSAPVSRKPRTPGRSVRRLLGLPSDAKAVLITMGGIPSRYEFLDRLRQWDTAFFVIPGGSGKPERQGNLILLPHHGKFYHPDLIHACDAVVGKVGYSTLAEVYWAGIPFGHVSRPTFRESAKLADFIRRRMTGAAVGETAFLSGEWAAQLDALLAMHRCQPDGPNGADQIARFLQEMHLIV